MHELIADMPMDERPRERMLTHGAKSLSDAELLAVLLGSGIPEKNAIELARDLLREGIPALAQCDVEQLIKREGMGIAKATRIIAAFELARRFDKNKPGDPPHFDVNTFSRGFIARSRSMTQEHLGALFLDSRRRVLREREIFVGTASKALVSTREVMRYALDANASGVVLYHNHPSGDPSPSDEDLRFTRKIDRSLRLIDMHLVDHIIAGAHGFTSLSTRGFR
ncbi:MAG TPA: DNA repair protein RadC [Thermoanaerobaculia bacterium]